MTTTTPTIRPAAMLPPVEVASSVGLLRLARVELRKLVDTRAGLWLLVLSVVSAVAAAGLWLSLSLDDPQLPWYGPVSLVSAPVTVLLPVVAILAFTQEWSQRTSLTTFTLEPRRGRVIGAKLLAIALVTIAGALLCLALSAASALLASAIGSGTLVWAFEATDPDRPRHLDDHGRGLRHAPDELAHRDRRLLRHPDDHHDAVDDPRHHRHDRQMDQR